MPRTYKQKIGNTRGCAEWLALDTVGDTKRFLRWIVLSMRDGTLRREDAAVFIQAANVLLKAADLSGFEQQLNDLKEKLNAVYAPHVENGISRH